jgi:hypothetical protein
MLLLNLFQRNIFLADFVKQNNNKIQVQAAQQSGTHSGGVVCLFLGTRAYLGRKGGGSIKILPALLQKL